MSEHRPDHFDIERQARLEERLVASQERIVKLEEKLDGVVSDVHEIKLMLAEIRGGWKIAVRIAAVAGALVGGAAAFISELFLRSVR